MISEDDISQLIMAWEPCLVSAMDGSTIVQVAGAAAGTVAPIVEGATRASRTAEIRNCAGSPTAH